MDWPFYTMCWGPPLPPTSLSFAALSSYDRQHYGMQRLYYAQSTDAMYDPYWNKFIGLPHTLVQAEMPLPSHPCIADMQAAATGDPAVLEDVFCSYVTDHKKLAHPGEINRIKALHQQPDVVLTHTDSPRVYVWDFLRQPNRIVKMNCRPHVPDLQLLGHSEEVDGAGGHPMYFALDTAQGDARVISGGPDHQVCMWELEDYVTGLAGKEGGGVGVEGGGAVGEGAKKRAGATTASLLHARGVYAGHTACVEDVAFHPSSSTLFTSVGDDRLMFLWDARIEGGGASSIATGHSDDVNAVSWNPVHEHLLLTASSDHRVHLMDVRKRGEGKDGGGDQCVVHRFEGHEREVKNVGWAPDGIHFASGGDDALVNVYSLHRMEVKVDVGLSKGETSPSALHRQFAEGLTPPDPALVFRHQCHPSSVQFFQWNPHHLPGLTMASIHGDTGGQMQIWRMNDMLMGDVEEVNAEVKQWRRALHKKKMEVRKEREKEKGGSKAGGGGSQANHTGHGKQR